MPEEHLARPFQRYIVCWYRITLSLLGGDLRFYRKHPWYDACYKLKKQWTGRRIATDDWHDSSSTVALHGTDVERLERRVNLNAFVLRLIHSNFRAIIIIIFYLPKKEAGYTRKAEAHHTLVAHYITIVNVRIKHISTYKHSKQVYHSTHYTLTLTQT